jgi:cell division septum initiation protein DivIVA
MERIDFNRIKKMPPDRRIKALKEIQDELDSFIKEKSKEIDESQQEIRDAQDFLKEAQEELQVLEEMQAEAPKIKKIDVEKLFEPQKKKGERELEDIAEEAPKTAPPSDQEAYISRLAQQPISNIYERIRAIGDEIRTTGTISPYQQERLEMFGEAIREKEQAIRAGEYAPGKKAEHLLTAAEKAISYATRR